MYHNTYNFVKRFMHISPYFHCLCKKPAVASRTALRPPPSLFHYLQYTKPPCQGDVVNLRIFRCKRSTGTFAKEAYPIAQTGGKRSCPLPPIQAVAWISPFLRAPKGWRRAFRRLRTATRDAVPGPCKPFEKGLTENFYTFLS